MYKYEKRRTKLAERLLSGIDQMLLLDADASKREKEE
jgi:hypothetical protein